MDVILMDRWVIGLLNALIISRDPSSLHSHHLHLPSTLQDLVVILRQDDEVSITTRAMPLPTPQGSSSSILKILNIKVGTFSTRKDLCLISLIQLEDLVVSRGTAPAGRDCY
ncbi:hypothetical protein ACFX1S_013325 [Malus domestica]